MAYKSIQELIKEDPSFFNKKPAGSIYWEKVTEQSNSHTRRNDGKDIFNTVRPNEEEYILDYRAKNYRNITMSGVVRFISKLTRIFSNANIEIHGFSESLQYL